MYARDFILLVINRHKTRVLFEYFSSNDFVNYFWIVRNIVNLRRMRNTGNFHLIILGVTSYGGVIYWIKFFKFMRTLVKRKQNYFWDMIFSREYCKYCVKNIIIKYFYVQ